jgi:hypothetical protein
MTGVVEETPSKLTLLGPPSLVTATSHGEIQVGIKVIVLTTQRATANIESVWVGERSYEERDWPTKPTSRSGGG